MEVKKLAVAFLMAAFLVKASPSWAQQNPAVVDRAALDRAVAEKVRSDESARDSIRTLLQRDEVKEVAGAAGLDLKRAESSVSSLEGPELARIADRAAVANDLLAGGDVNIHIGLIALLLIIIIVILLAH